jgi:hypothetical protein
MLAFPDGGPSRGRLLPSVSQALIVAGGANDHMHCGLWFVVCLLLNGTIIYWPCALVVVQVSCKVNINAELLEEGLKNMPDVTHTHAQVAIVEVFRRAIQWFVPIFDNPWHCRTSGICFRQVCSQER